MCFWKKKMNKCKYPLDKVDFALAYVPADISALVLPFTLLKFRKKLWDKMADTMAKYDINSTRFFLTCTEDDWQKKNTIVCFKKKAGGKYDLTEFDETKMGKLEERLESFWQRDITTIICIGKDIKEARFRFSPWHGKNNINGTVEDAKDFMRDETTQTIFDTVFLNLWERWKTKPIIFEFINEPSGAPELLFSWYDKRIKVGKKAKIPMKRMALNFFHSGKCLELLTKHPKVWVFLHGVNQTGWFQRFNKAGTELQEYFFTKFPHFAADSDGHSVEYPGKGLVGKVWNPVFKRPSPLSIKQGLKYTIKHQGHGWIIMSAAAYIDTKDGNKPDLVRWKKIAEKGIEKNECGKYGVNWNEFSEIIKDGDQIKVVKLPELLAIKKAARSLMGD